MPRPKYVPFDYSLPTARTTTTTAPRTTATPAPKEKQTGKVYIYIDNSNLWIQGQRTYAEKNRLTSFWDPTWRFDAGKVKGVLLASLSAEEETFDYKIKLYGSTPPPVDTVWTAIKSHNIEVSTHARSSWTRREKEVDNDIIAESVDNSTDAYHNATPAVFIIVSGDRDLRPAIIRITKRGFHVHLWSWRNGLSKVFTEPDDEIESSLFHVHYLDPYLEKVGFRQTTFRVDRGVIHPHSIVVLDPLPKATHVEDFIKDLKTPAFRYAFPIKRAGASSNDLAIIPASAQYMKFDDLQNLFMESKAKLERNGLVVLPYSSYLQQYPPRKGMEGTLARSKRFGEMGKYFNEAVGKDDEGDDAEEGGREQGVVDTKEKREQQEDGNGEDHDDPNKRIVEKHHERTNRRAVEDNPRAGDDADDGFTDVTRRLQKRSRQLNKAENSLQQHCYWREYCPHGLDCKHGHTKKEEEDFKTYGVRPATKYQYCHNKDCLRGERCRFAHDQKELFCPTCKMTGEHEMHDCPKRKKSSTSARTLR